MSLSLKPPCRGASIDTLINGPLRPPTSYPHTSPPPEIRLSKKAAAMKDGIFTTVAIFEEVEKMELHWNYVQVSNILISNQGQVTA